MNDYSVGRAVPIHRHIPELPKSRSFRHSAESIPELEKKYEDLLEMVKKLMTRVYCLEQKGHDE